MRANKSKTTKCPKCRLLEEKASRPKLPANVRSLKIQPFDDVSRPTRKVTPLIQLKGAWLQACGFAPHQRVLVTTAPGQLIIRLEEEEALAQLAAATTKATQEPAGSQLRKAG
ncbi:MAG: SymE family type I addiction module toxin [Bacteroidota bacterium]